MGLVYPVYTPDELDALDEKKRRQLQKAILLQLQTSPEILGLLRARTLPTYEKLSGKRTPAKKKK
jgi:hypothetical protein